MLRGGCGGLLRRTQYTWKRRRDRLTCADDEQRILGGRGDRYRLGHVGSHALLGLVRSGQLSCFLLHVVTQAPSQLCWRCVE